MKEGVYAPFETASSATSPFTAMSATSPKASTSKSAPTSSRSKTSRQLRPTATLYEASSQYRRWTFEAKKLNTIRKVVNKRAVDACKEHFKEEEVRVLLPIFEV